MQIKKYRSGLLIIVYIAFGIYCFVLGDNGIFERVKLLKGRQEITDNITKLDTENKALQREFSIISNNSTNIEVYKKEASESGFISSNEKYIYFNGEKNKANLQPVSMEAEKYPVKLSHLRILWGISSIMIILFYLARKRKVLGDESQQ